MTSCLLICFIIKCLAEEWVPQPFIQAFTSEDDFSLLAHVLCSGRRAMLPMTYEEAELMSSEEDWSGDPLFWASSWYCPWCAIIIMFGWSLLGL